MSNEVYIDGVNVAECYDKCNSYCDYGAYFRQEQLQRAKADYSNLLKLYSNEQYKRKSCEQRLNEIKDIIEYYKNLPVEINKNVNRIIEGYKNE